VRVLFATTRGAGHFGPLVPFARACAGAGHEVLVAGPEAATAMVAESGLPFRAFADAPPDELGAVFGRVFSLPPDEANRLVIGEVMARVHARAALPGLREIVAGFGPDVLLREPAEFASAIVAGEAGVPQVRVAASLVVGEETYLEWATPAVEEVAPGTIERTRVSPFLTTVPPSLEDPTAPGGPGVARFREAADPAAPGDPLVYVSFGSIAPTMGFYPGLYRAAVDELRGFGLPVLVTVGRDVDPAELGPLPDGVRVEPWVPQREVMTAARAMVGHGGFGSTVLAVAAGVPQVLVPLFADQPLNARRVAEAGAGIALAGPDAVPGELRAAVARALDEPGLRAGAQALAAEVAALPPIDEAPALLERVAARDLAARGDT
jgi:UDP:flavonoid glycosyltransferase YjiC (YdhE family)